tara:strand:+ start:248 stop:454 length:207 start_codon:yes stop_codon:yes gene_type:complete
LRKKNTSSTYFFYKSVLRKVSFNAVLFKKELNKALLALPEKEGERLYRWALTFSKIHPELHTNLQYVP